MMEGSSSAIGQSANSGFPVSSFPRSVVRSPRPLGIVLISCILVSSQALAVEPESPQASLEQIQQWIKQLDSAKFVERRQAAERLKGAGPLASPEVWKAATTSESAEVRAVATAVAKILQDESVRALRAQKITVHIESDGWVRALGGDPQSPEKLTDASATHLQAFPRLSALVLEAEGITDDGVRNIASLKDLNNLKIKGTRVTDDGLRCLANLPKLQSISLDSAVVRGEGLRYCSNGRNLQSLSIDGNGWMDSGLAAGLKALSNCNQLRHVSLSGTGIGINSLSSLKALPVTGVVLRDCKITQQTIQHLSAVNDLVNLAFENCSVSKEAMTAIVAHLPELETLGLVATDVTFESVQQVQGLKKLRAINVGFGELSKDEVRRLRELLPEVDVLGINSAK